MRSLFDLAGKVALVTGGARGLGRAMAEALARHGAGLAINGRDGEAARTAAGEIAREHGVWTLGAAADVTDAAAFGDFVREVIRQRQRIDILITNAGINRRMPTDELSLADWHQVMEVNLTGPFLCSRAVLPHMKDRGFGRVIHISSILGQVGLRDRSPYAASKGGVLLLTRTQALELAPWGITVNALCPGPFATEMNRELLRDPAKYQDFVSRIPLGRWGEMNELDGAIVFLASDSSSYMTGASLTIDGGWTAQ